jgi:hypothetical protein
MRNLVASARREQYFRNTYSKGETSMSRIYKKTIYRPIPASAEIVKQHGKKFAVWQDANGNEVKLEIVVEVVL